MSLRMKPYTDYDLAHLEELQRVVCTNFRPKESHRTRMFNIVAGIGFEVFALVMLIRQKVPAAIFFMLFGAFMVTRGILFYRFLALGVRQRMDKAVNGSEYILEKSYMLVINSRGSNQYSYSRCDRLLETENNIYFILEGGQGLLLDKNNLKGGSVEELRAWMGEKCQKSIEWVGKPRKEEK